jgi:branched-chain amino acid transport system ATP-binding protein
MPAPSQNNSRRDIALAALSGIAPTPGVSKPDPIIVADNVVRKFGGLTAVNVGHLEIQRGAITALIGPNGAGKTTFFNLLTGFDQVDEGSWTFNGIKISGTPPHKVARMGMVRTFQLTKALYRLTVIDNMLLAATKQKGESILRAALPFLWNAQEKAATARSEELLTRFKLIDKRDDFAAGTSSRSTKLIHGGVRYFVRDSTLPSEYFCNIRSGTSSRRSRTWIYRSLSS